MPGNQNLMLTFTRISCRLLPENFFPDAPCEALKKGLFPPLFASF